MEFTFVEVTDRSAVVRTIDNVVINIIIAPPTEPAPKGCFLVDISDGRFCDIGWIWDGTDFYNPNPEPIVPDVPQVSTNVGEIMNELINSNPNNIPAIHDHVYVNGEMVREDVSVVLPEAAPVLALLRENFPDSTINYESIPNNVIGMYNSYRPPYTDESISWYEMTKPSKELLQSYGITENMYPDIYNWYALKHNLVTKEIMLKVVFKGNSLDRTALPEIPNVENGFFARIHRIDGSVEPYLDCYFSSAENIVIEYCQKYNIPYTSVADKPGYTWIYGVTFNYDTKEIITVKNYKRILG